MVRKLRADPGISGQRVFQKIFQREERFKIGEVFLAGNNEKIISYQISQSFDPLESSNLLRHTHVTGILNESALVV